MKRSTLKKLRCAANKKCGGELQWLDDDGMLDVLYGTLSCKKCREEFPVLAGVAVVVPDVAGYLLHHVKGISKFVPDAKIPKAIRQEYLKAKSDIPEEYMEEDLESDRVNALYLMNHYLSVENSGVEWWKVKSGSVLPAFEALVKTHWDHGPFEKVSTWVAESKTPRPSLLELGCGVGGLYHRVASKVSSYLGVDGSFHSIMMARHFNLGAEFEGKKWIPEDLLNGPVSQTVKWTSLPKAAESSEVDFVVGVIDLLPIAKATFDISVSMNTIDMLDDPRILPVAQHSLLKADGLAIQCGPYIWHDQVAKRLRSQLPKSITESSRAVESMYEKAGFHITATEEHIPWIFFKHARQIELYSVHAFSARKVG